MRIGSLLKKLTGINPGFSTKADVSFHGAFATKRAAKQKEREIGGAGIITRRIRGNKRYVVIKSL